MICQRKRLLAMLCGMAIVQGCTGTDDAATPTDGLVEGDVYTEIELVLDGITPASGTCSELSEVETPARTGADACAAGIELWEASCYGIFMGRPVFASRSVGTASSMLEPVWLTWSATDPDANGDEVTDQWRGTVTVSEWSAGRIAFDLDGERCTYQDLNSCVPASGSLVIDGDFDSPSVATGAYPSPAWQDIATGNLLCSSDYP